METWQLIVIGVIIHTIFFYSIFDIYFVSPIVHGMTPHRSPTRPPAKRLVLFSVDGLRADKTFELDKDGKTRVPYLRSIIEKTGAWGVSHTHVPTETRPGHVAMIAGVYEDISETVKGWKDTPVEFDSVFNESRYTWSWGSPEVLNMFAKGATGDNVFTKTYPPHYEAYDGTGHAKLDTWVFDEVKEFFTSSHDYQGLKDKLQQDKLVFFLHLLGVDTNGHIKKPDSDDYLENIRLVDSGIQEMVGLIEKYYNHDGKTAYVMSSDHGMTDWGSHGAGYLSETMTPLVVWGSGVRGTKHGGPKYDDTFSQDWKLDHLWRTDVEQGDIAPLMSALIGANFPLNSLGVLPHDYLSLPDVDLAEIMYANTRQLLEQYQVTMELKTYTTLSFAFRPFKELTAVKLADSHRHIQHLLQSDRHQDVVDVCERLMKTALKGLNYYQTYDRLFLGVNICSGFVGWMVYVLTVVFEYHSGIYRSPTRLGRQNIPWWSHDRTVITMFSMAAVVIVLLLFVQSLPWTNYLYCLIPVVLWMTVVLRRDILVQVYHYTLLMKNRSSVLLAILASLVGLEILVMGFFYLEMLSVGLALIVILSWTSSNTLAYKAKTQLLLWSVCCMILAVFPMLPVVKGKRSTANIFIGGVLILAGTVYTSLRTKSFRDLKSRDVLLVRFQQVAITVATYFSSSAVENGLAIWQHAISWTLLGLVFVEPLLCTTQVFMRLHTLVLAFAAPFILLSVSYEIIFLVSLVLLLYHWLQVECSMIPRASNTPIQDRSWLEVLDFKEHDYRLVNKRKYLVIADIQRAFYYVFLILTAFFGTGNIASINTYDLSAMLCFVDEYYPFIIFELMLLKIVIPFILVTCALRALRSITGLPVDGLFLIILLIFDCMALHFFFLVQDYGSWLDIGTSISHFIIVMCSIIFNMILFGLSHILTTFTLI